MVVIGFIFVIGAADGVQAQLELPATPVGPGTRTPVPLKREQSVAVGSTSVRILVLGDAGIRSGGWGGDTDAARQSVAAEARRVCSEKTCDLVVMLGDNLYDKGIRKGHIGEDEAALAEIVSSFLARPETPVYLVMGNHDWSPRIPRHSTVDRQLAWIGNTEEPDVRGNAHFYHFDAGPVGIWVLDSNPLVRRGSFNRDPALLRWLDGIAASESSWKIVFAHHPMRSNGEHGNPGHYREPPLPFSIWPGRGYRELLDSKIEGIVDVHIAGHEHNMQFLSDVGVEDSNSGTAVAVVGSASKCTGPGKRLLNPGMELEAYNYGFAIVEASPARLEIEFHLEDGKSWTQWHAWRERESGWEVDDTASLGAGRDCIRYDSCCPTPMFSESRRTPGLATSQGE